MIRQLALLLLALAAVFFAGCATNPITGETELMLIGEDQDVEIGRKYAPRIEEELGGRIEDPVLQQYVDRVGKSVARVSQKPYFDYHFVALNDESTNAFALPGGYIFITRGMLEKLQTESQLAAVLAHETAHVVARDVANAMSNQIGMTILLAAMATSGAPGEAVRAADLTTQIIGLKFSRTDEQYADLGGMDYMVRAGYNPYGMVETMQMLESLSGTRPPEFLSTHPSPENRIGYITQDIQRKYAGVEALKKGKAQYKQLVLDRLDSAHKGEFEVLIAAAYLD